MTYSKTLLPPEVYFWTDKYNLFRGGDDPQGARGDAIGRTFYALMAYQDPDLLDAIMLLWEFNHPKNIVTGVRHPEMPLTDKMSRDHYIYTLCAVQLGKKLFPESIEIYDSFISEMNRRVPFRIKKMARMPLSLVLWTRALNGNHTAQLWFYILQGITSRMYVPSTKAAFYLAGIEEEADQQHWVPIYLQVLPVWKQWIVKNVAFPSYAITFTGFQFDAIDNGRYPNLHNWNLKPYHKIIGKTNYLQRILFKIEVPKSKVLNYRPMTKMRWTGYLNRANDRPLRNTHIHVANNLDMDLLRTVYFNSNLNLS